MAKNILIVDSDKGFSTILSEGLNGHEAFSAVVVHTSTAALQFVVERPIDLVIIDMSVNDVPPAKLIHAIKEAKSGMPVMVTPLIGQPVPSDVQQLDIQGVLPKPFFVGDLPRLVGDVLNMDLDSQIPELPEVEEVKPQPKRIPRSERSARRRATTARSTTSTRSKPDPTPAPSRRRPRSSRSSSTSSPSGEEVYVASLSTRKLERLRDSQETLVRQLEDMNRDFRAEVILLTAGSELIAKAGTMADKKAQELTLLVARGAEAAAQAASFLGERAGSFEQSLHEGSRYRLYSYSLGEGVVLSMALSISVPLGIVRHQTRRTCQKLIKEYIR